MPSNIDVNKTFFGTTREMTGERTRMFVKYDTSGNVSLKPITTVQIKNGIRMGCQESGKFYQQLVANAIHIPNGKKRIYVIEADAYLHVRIWSYEPSTDKVTRVVEDDEFKEPIFAYYDVRSNEANEETLPIYLVSYNGLDHGTLHQYPLCMGPYSDQLKFADTGAIPNFDTSNGGFDVSQVDISTIKEELRAMNNKINAIESVTTEAVARFPMR